MKFISSGAQADVYKDGSKAIKLFKNKCDIEYETGLQKMAFDCGLPVPEVFGITEIDGKSGIVMEYIEGTPVGNIVSGDTTKSGEYLIKTIELQNRIHSIEARNFPSLKDKLKYFISRNEVLGENEKKDILLDLESRTFENKLCHGDFHVLNLIQTPNGIKIIDWITAASGNPDADIYRTYLLYKISTPDFAEIYLDTYCKMMALDKAKILSWSSIVAGARLGEYVKDENEKNVLLEIIRGGLS